MSELMDGTVTGASGMISLIEDELLPIFARDREKLDLIDEWSRWEPASPNIPARGDTREYRALAANSRTPWPYLVIEAMAQGLQVKGYRSDARRENDDAWGYWQGNGMDRRQHQLHRTALTYGLSYASVSMGIDQLTGEPIPLIEGYSPRQFAAFYADTRDEWPACALRATRGSRGERQYVLWTPDAKTHLVKSPGAGETRYEWLVLGVERFDSPVTPVVRYVNRTDDEGRIWGEVEPIIDLARRLNQTTFDRLVVQRFAAWVVRTISGMTLPEDNTESAKLRLAADRILVAEDPDTKFGSLAASPMDGFISAHDSDLRDFAALTQVPPQMLLGQMANLSAEALNSAKDGFFQKQDLSKTNLGESHEALLRLCTVLDGKELPSRASRSQIRWADKGAESFAAITDALTKLKTIGVPAEMLFEKIPGWTAEDVELAKRLIESGDELSKLVSALGSQVGPGQPGPTAPNTGPAPSPSINPGTSGSAGSGA